MTRLLYIARSLAIAALLLLLLAVAPAIAQNVVLQGETSTLSVEAEPDYNYKWELYSDGTGNLATEPGNALPSEAVFIGSPNQPSVEVHWIEPGVYYYKVTVSDITGCSMNAKIGQMEVKPSLPTAVIKLDPEEMCQGEIANLEVTFTGIAPWSIKLQIEDENGSKTEEYKEIDVADNPYNIAISPKITAKYTVIEVSNDYGVQTIPSNTIGITVHPLPKSSPIYLKNNN